MMKRLIQIGAAGSCIVLLVGLWVLLQIPSDREIRGCLTTKMYHVHLCPGGKDYVPIGEISEYLQKALVMSEDTTFYSHHGFDWDEMERSAKQNWEKGQFKRGGSTISQQLAKNMFLSKDKTLFRKGIEALITMRIEAALKKHEILERYLNVVEYGKQLYGVKAAAEYYFHKSPAKLDLAESTFLVMLLPSPAKYAKSFTQKSLTPFAHSRLQHIMGNLLKTGKITADEYSVGMGEMSYFLGGVEPGQENPNGSEFDPFEGDQ